MALWALDYSLDIEALKVRGYSESDAEVLRAAVETALAEKGFNKHSRTGLHISAQDEVGSAYSACLKLSAMVESESIFKWLYLYRFDEATDLLPLIRACKTSTAGGSQSRMAEKAPAEVDDACSLPDATVGSILKAFVQDLFFDDPEPATQERKIA